MSNACWVIGSCWILRLRPTPNVYGIHPSISPLQPRRQLPSKHQPTKHISITGTKTVSLVGICLLIINNHNMTLSQSSWVDATDFWRLCHCFCWQLHRSRLCRGICWVCHVLMDLPQRHPKPSAETWDMGCGQWRGPFKGSQCYCDNDKNI